MSVKDYLQQQIDLNGNIFGNKCYCCNEGSLYLLYVICEPQPVHPAKGDQAPGL